MRVFTSVKLLSRCRSYHDELCLLMIAMQSSVYVFQLFSRKVSFYY